MVIGNGLLANSLNKFESIDSVIVFASGVSNSKEHRKSEFDRELDLIKKYQFQYSDKRIIYFSTCSIFDNTLINSPYITHKLNIENFIKNNFKIYNILRLPNVIGDCKNKNTFFNFFKEKIVQNEEITIQKFATRYLIDIDDITFLLPLIINQKEFCNNSINIAFDNKMLVSKILNLFEIVLNRKIKNKIISDGSNYDIENKDFLFFLKKINFKTNENYNLDVLKKYKYIFDDKFTNNK